MTEREELLRSAIIMANMNRWRRVAEIEHKKHCKQKHDCRAAVERIYVKLLEDDRG